jgi:hypothetical protein
MGPKQEAFRPQRAHCAAQQRTRGRGPEYEPSNPALLMKTAELSEANGRPPLR